MPSALVEAFLTAWQRPAGVAQADELVLDGLLAAARAEYPEVTADVTAYGALLAERAAGPPPVPIAELPAADLWLALGCAGGDPQALRTLEGQTFPDARGVLRRMGLHSADIDEVLQILRERFFVAETGEVPGILPVAGRGSLRGLIRVAAARTALNLRRRDKRMVLSDEPLYDALESEDQDPELTALKSDLRAAFKAAVQDAVLGLEPWQRNVLRLHLVHGLSIDAIGGSYRVHRATAARWLAAIRARIRDNTSALLRSRVGEEEVCELYALIQSRLDVSVGRLLASEPPVHGSGDK